MSNRSTIIVAGGSTMIQGVLSDSKWQLTFTKNQEGKHLTSSCI